MIYEKKIIDLIKVTLSCTLYTIGRFTFFRKTKSLNSHKKKIYKEEKRKTIKRNILVGIRETKRSEKECGSNDQLIRHRFYACSTYLLVITYIYIFLSFFVFVFFVCRLMYVCFYNKKKIILYVCMCIFF